ncbi:MAG: hypothetical protein WC685_15645 [Methylobacter sp.]|jgi:hypothetical protein
MSEIKVRPHIGAKYENPDIFPYKTLILGESNYADPEQFGLNIVKDCIEDDLNGRDSNFQRFSTKTRRVIFGRDTKIEPEEFWENVAFYNFVQFLVGNQSKVRPTPEMWSNSVPAFKEVIFEIKPERILVLGSDNWKNLLSHIEYMQMSERECTAMLNIDIYTVLSGYINHPVSVGFEYSKWQPIAKNLLFKGC